MREFYALYTKCVIHGTLPEYLTEKQHYDTAPIAIDLDFRYDTSITTRQHSKEHITDFIYAYCSKLTEYIDFTDTPIPIYIMEKPNVNKLESVTKDGVHIIIGLNVPRSLQLCLRDKMISEMKEMWSDLEELLINDWESVYDLGIVKGTTNWQLFGSRKIKHERYWLTGYYQAVYNTSDNDFEIEDNQVDSFNITKNLEKLSIRYKEHPTFPVKASMMNLLNTIQPKTHKKITTKKMCEIPIGTSVWYQLTSMEKVNEYITLLIEGIRDDQNSKWGIQNYYLIEAYDYTMALPVSYYGPGSYERWIAVGWALRNTDYNLFPIWLAFSGQCKTFDWSNTTTENSDGSMNLILLIRLWNDMSPVHGGKTLRSLMYWVGQENPTAYKDIKDRSIGAYIDETLNENLEFDIANVVYQAYKDIYACVSIKNNRWFQYRNGRWHEIDQGTTLRHSLSTSIYKLYRNKSNELQDQLTSIDPTENTEQYELLKQRCNRA